MATVTNPTRQALWCDALKRVLEPNETVEITEGQEAELITSPIFVVTDDKGKVIEGADPVDSPKPKPVVKS